MSKLLATTIIAGALGLAAFTPAVAAQTRADGIANSGMTQAVVADELSAARRHRRYGRYYYPRYGGAYPYGYYGPTYYDRPYSRPAPVFFGLGGWW